MTRMTLATVVPMKGTSVEFPFRRILAVLKELGLEGADVVLKSDQENFILDVLNNVASRRSASSKVEPLFKEEPPCPQGRNIPESSPVGS